MNLKPQSEFERAGSNLPSRGLLSDILAFLLTNKKWWMAPIIVVLFLFGVLIYMSGSALAPFIYSLF
jgi:Family of unknown function (DUF5989)